MRYQQRGREMPQAVEGHMRKAVPFQKTTEPLGGGGRVHYDPVPLGKNPSFLMPFIAEKELFLRLLFLMLSQQGDRTL